jgi:CDP-diacylglycerol---glycerol-3-phosphate 3-phosphatidyltransferase
VSLKPVPAVPVVNVANMLTVVRIVLVPVFVVLVLNGDMVRTGWQAAACAVFVVASLTDYVDGWVARSRNLVTAFGKVADPIADKALTGTALVLLSGYGRLAWWVTIVILARELGVTALRFWVLRHGVIPASRGGKIKTALQIVAIGWYFCPLPDSLAVLAPWLMAVAVLVTVGTGLDYVLRALQLRRAASAVAGSSFPAAGGGQMDLLVAPNPGPTPAIAPGTPHEESPA